MKTLGHWYYLWRTKLAWLISLWSLPAPIVRVIYWEVDDCSPCGWRTAAEWSGVPLLPGDYLDNGAGRIYRITRREAHYFESSAMQARPAIRFWLLTAELDKEYGN